MDRTKISADATGVLSGAALMSLSGSAAEQALNALPLEQQLTCVLQVPWKDRMRMIMQSRAARELVQALPPEEVFWMVKQQGVEDALPIIARTSHDQFQYLIDLDCWHRDELDPDTCLSWYRMLGRCNQAKVLEWFSRADESLLVAGLKQYVSVCKIEEESDISEEYEDMPPCTLDGINHFRFVSEDAQLAVLPLFRVLLSNDPGRFQSLIEGLIWDSRIETEDEALHWRQSRAAENGFPEFDEALGIYQPLHTAELQNLTSPGFSKSERSEPPNAVQTRYAFSGDRLPDFLRAALSACSADQLEDFEQHLITTANKVMIADCMQVRDIEDVYRALRKTSGYVSIGLEHLSDGDITAACEIMTACHPELLFRCAAGIISALAGRVRSHNGHVWTDTASRFAILYGSPLADTAFGLVRSRPLFYEGLVSEGTLYRDFARSADVAAAAAAVERLITADRLLFEICALDLDELERLCVSTGAINDPAEMTMSALLASLLIAHSLRPDTCVPLLEPDDLSSFTARLTEIAGNDIARGLELFAGQSCSRLARETGAAVLDAQALKYLINECLQPLHDMLGVPETDLRCMSAVLIKRM
jgi:hypothetical protein